MTNEEQGKAEGDRARVEATHGGECIEIEREWRERGRFKGEREKRTGETEEHIALTTKRERGI